MRQEQHLQQQFGVITRSQARACGLTERQIDHRLATGTWKRVHRSVYRHAISTKSWESQLIAAVLALDGVASHRCAAALWGLELFHQPAIELTVAEAASLRWPADVIVHRSTQWASRGKSKRRRIPCTSIERTLIDCGHVVGVQDLERLCESAVRQGLTSWKRIDRHLRTYARRGRNGAANLRELVDGRNPAGAVPLSDFSRRVANLLAEAGLPEPILEYRIHDETGHTIMQADLAWPEMKKAWELDGLRWHFGREDVERDRRKRNKAKTLGWRIQEILWSMYKDERHELVAMARAFLLEP